MEKETAKMLGYKVIDEFGTDIASRVYLKFEESKVVKVIDEFGLNISSIVRITKAN